MEITPLANDNYFEAKENWIEKFITLPLVSILQFLGYYCFADGNKVYYTNISLENLQSVYIAPMCSGIYSIQVFFSAFGSYLLVFQKKIGRDILPIFLLGLLMSYISNLLRLVMVILAGHYYGSDALYWTHQNLGWILFTTWMFIFWIIFERFTNAPKYS
ncbi:MAG: exosortase/archaeosortase family protein [Candidatus Poseidoniales archaeon]